jgi:hypothetical protein
MELILFDKYLVRGYEGGFVLSKVRDGFQPIVLDGQRESKSNANQGGMVAYRDYSNFGKETYPSTFESVLASIRRQELSDREITTLEQLSETLKEIKQIELEIQSKFK